MGWVKSVRLFPFVFIFQSRRQPNKHRSPLNYIADDHFVFTLLHVEILPVLKMQCMARQMKIQQFSFNITASLEDNPLRDIQWGLLRCPLQAPWKHSLWTAEQGLFFTFLMKYSWKVTSREAQRKTEGTVLAILCISWITASVYGRFFLSCRRTWRPPTTWLNSPWTLSMRATMTKIWILLRTQYWLHTYI